MKRRPRYPWPLRPTTWRRSLRSLIQTEGRRVDLGDRHCLAKVEAFPPLIEQPFDEGRIAVIARLPAPRQGELLIEGHGDPIMGVGRWHAELPRGLTARPAERGPAPNSTSQAGRFQADSEDRRRHGLDGQSPFGTPTPREARRALPAFTGAWPIRMRRRRRRLRPFALGREFIQPGFASKLALRLTGTSIRLGDGDVTFHTHD